jgi:hypothetical protein
MCFACVGSVIKKTKLIWILSTTLTITFIFGGIICVVILQKYRMSALVLHEIQQGMYKLMFRLLYCVICVWCVVYNHLTFGYSAYCICSFKGSFKVGVPKKEKKISRFFLT